MVEAMMCVVGNVQTGLMLFLFACVGHACIVPLNTLHLVVYMVLVEVMLWYAIPWCYMIGNGLRARETIQEAEEVKGLVDVEGLVEAEKVAETKI
jgi:antibiotic biosynthesis monooxygenase (ABM) superfamily enzyme